jgi:hypothetical protein
MRQNIESWATDYARAIAFVERLYAEERQTKAVAA